MQHDLALTWDICHTVGLHWQCEWQATQPRQYACAWQPGQASTGKGLAPARPCHTFFASSCSQRFWQQALFCRRPAVEQRVPGHEVVIAPGTQAVDQMLCAISI